MGFLETLRDWMGQVATPCTVASTMSPSMFSDIPCEKIPRQVS